MEQQAWQLAEEKARLALGPLAAALQTNRPAEGLHALAWKHYHLEATRLFTVQWATGHPPLADLEEAFVRAHDLVASYGETAQRPLRLQLHWRALTLPHELPESQGNAAAQAILAGCELVISVHTSVLESDPALRVASAWGWQRGTEVLELVSAAPGEAETTAWSFTEEPLRTSGPERSWGAYLCRWPGQPFTLAQLIYPSDFTTSELRWAGCSGPVECTYLLFQQPLEKGVIRRARLRSLFLPRERDVEWAVAAYQEFSRSPLPLTA